MTIHCPECDTEIPLPDDLVVSGVPRVRCRQCGTRFRVLPGGHTLALDGAVTGTGRSGGGPNGSVSGAGFGSDGAPSAPPAAGGVDLPNLTVMAGFDQGRSGSTGTSGRLLDYPSLPVGTVFRNKYRIDAEIGQGASAVVYRVHDLDADVDMALKVVGVVGGDADALRKAWAEEYKARRQVADGRHLLSVESPQVEERDGTTYVALPQELGELTLRGWLQQARSEIEAHRDEALRLFDEVCRGVESLHEAGLSHLDLKPENILLLSGAKDRLTAKVGDFGLARIASSLTRRQGAGTPAYMAPEQVSSAREKDIGPWSDIYALGCILFELLDGDGPFSGSAEELKAKHLEMAPPELEGVPAHLQALIDACLSKARGDRPGSVAEVRVQAALNAEEEAAFAQAQAAASEEGWRLFLADWSMGRYGQTASENLATLETERKAREEAARMAKEEAKRAARAQVEHKEWEAGSASKDDDLEGGQPVCPDQAKSQDSLIQLAAESSEVGNLSKRVAGKPSLWELYRNDRDAFFMRLYRFVPIEKFDMRKKFIRTSEGLSIKYGFYGWCAVVELDYAWESLSTFVTNYSDLKEPMDLARAFFDWHKAVWRSEPSGSLEFWAECFSGSREPHPDGVFWVEVGKIFDFVNYLEKTYPKTSPREGISL